MHILKILTEKRLIGNKGERIAARMLRRHGYKIIDKNFVAEGHEIEIVAKNRDFLVFAEVKTRTVGAESSMEQGPASAVNEEKRRSIIRAAKCFPTYLYPDKKIRFDIIEVYLTEEGKPKDTVHMEGAFVAPGRKSQRR